MGRDIYQFGDKYMADTGDGAEPATAEEIAEFQERHRRLDEEGAKRRVLADAAERQWHDTHDAAIKAMFHENEDEDADGPFISSHWDEDTLVYRLSTMMFDVDGCDDEKKWHDEIKAKFGKDIYKAALEGFKNGDHDT